jgi:hypothetical protein
MADGNACFSCSGNCKPQFLDGRNSVVSRPRSARPDNFCDALADVPVNGLDERPSVVGLLDVVGGRTLEARPRGVVRVGQAEPGIDHVFQGVDAMHVQPVDVRIE